MKAYRGVRGIDSLIFNLGSRRRWVGCGRFNPGKNSGTHWIGDGVNLRPILEVVHTRNCLAPTRIRVPYCPAPKLVAVLTTSPRLTRSLYRDHAHICDQSTAFPIGIYRSACFEIISPPPTCEWCRGLGVYPMWSQEHWHLARCSFKSSSSSVSEFSRFRHSAPAL